MSLTPHHAKYFAHDLTRRATSGMDRLSMALFGPSLCLLMILSKTTHDNERIAKPSLSA
jgi:hypothetical protein